MFFCDETPRAVRVSDTANILSASCQGILWHYHQECLPESQTLLTTSPFQDAMCYLKILRGRAIVPKCYMQSRQSSSVCVLYPPADGWMISIVPKVEMQGGDADTLAPLLLWNFHRGTIVSIFAESEGGTDDMWRDRGIN